MSFRPSYKQWRRAKSSLVRPKPGFLETIFSFLDGFIATILACATLGVAYASYRISERQVEIADTLATIEVAKNQPGFSIESSVETSDFRQNGMSLASQVPETLTVTPRVGVGDLIAVNGQVSVFFTSPALTSPCVISVRGMFTQSTRDKVHLLEPAADDLQDLIDELGNFGIRTEGFYTEVLVSYVDLFGRGGLANYGEDGSDLEMSGFSELIGIESNDLTIYAGVWSGGQGFYFDSQDPSDFCPGISSIIDRTVRATLGREGDGGIERLPPTMRRYLDNP